MLAGLRVKWFGVFLLVMLGLIVAPVAAQTTPPFPFAQPGSYPVGLRLVRLVDTDRNSRNVDIAIWYPAIVPDKPDKQQSILGDPSHWGWLKAVPDLQDAPYPLILYSHHFTGSYLDFRTLDILLASHGYVVVGLNHADDTVQNAFVNRPIDVLFAIDQFAAMTTGDLAGLMDTNNVGVMGDSLGGYTALMMTGARIDPASASTLGAAPQVASDYSDHDPRTFFGDWNWDNLTAFRTSLTSLPPLSGNDLWPPFTDPRIHAALMLSPCFAPLFGKHGLATATVPSLVVGGSRDIDCPYQQDDAYIFANLGSQDRYLLSVVNDGHVPGMREAVFTQLYTAFFNVYLKGQQDDAQYLTAHYVDSVETQLKRGLVWGVYNGG